MRVRETLKTNGELHVTRTDNVLDLEFREFGIEAKLLDDARILARRKTRVIFRLGARDNHFARSEYKRRCLRIANAHDDGGESLEKEHDGGKSDGFTSKVCRTNLRIVLRIPCVKRDRLQVQPAVQIHRCDDILKSRHDTLDGGDVLLLEGKWSRCGRDSRRGCRRCSTRLRGTDRGRRLRVPLCLQLLLLLLGDSMLGSDRLGLRGVDRRRSRQRETGRPRKVGIGWVRESKAITLLTL